MRREVPQFGFGFRLRRSHGDAPGELGKIEEILLDKKAEFLEGQHPKRHLTQERVCVQALPYPLALGAKVRGQRPPRADRLPVTGFFAHVFEV